MLGPFVVLLRDDYVRKTRKSDKREVGRGRMRLAKRKAKCHRATIESSDREGLRMRGS